MTAACGLVFHFYICESGTKIISTDFKISSPKRKNCSLSSLLPHHIQMYPSVPLRKSPRKFKEKAHCSRGGRCHFCLLQDSMASASSSVTKLKKLRKKAAQQARVCFYTNLLPGEGASSVDYALLTKQAQTISKTTGHMVKSKRSLMITYLSFPGPFLTKLK